MTTRALGIDVGGSAVKLAVLAARELGPVQRVPHEARGLEAVVAAVARPGLARVQDTPGVPLGVSVAGLVRDGVVIRSGNLALADAPLRQALEAALGRRVDAFVSDARALGHAARGERGDERARVALGLGTGVGGSLVVGGEIVRDTGLGHGVALAEVAREPCALGHPSCLEAFLGSRALAAEASALGLAVETAAEVDALARRGEGGARALLERAGERLARGVACVLAEAALGDEPALLALSGGVAASETLREATARALGPGVRVILSRFGADAAVAGAALAALGG